MKSTPTKDLVEMVNVMLGTDPRDRAEVDAIKQRYELAMQLHAAREKQGLTQAELARRMGTSQSTVARLERGEIGSPNLSTLQKAAAALGIEFYAGFRTRRKSRHA